MAVKNVAASVLTRLKNQAKEENVSFQLILQLFVQEEFLRKLSASEYRDNLVLKGGMFIYTLTKYDARPTRDIDFLLQNLHGSLDNLENTMRNICDIDTGNDYILLEVTGTEQISLEKKYPGVRTGFIGRIGNVRIPFSIDVGIDDVIVPNAILREITSRLPEFDSPTIYTYSLESTIAEKLDAILDRMSGTSRMKDFYDIYYLSNIFDFSGTDLQDAIEKTLRHRNRNLNPYAFSEIKDFENNKFLNNLWKAFEPAKNSALTFGEVLQRLDNFLNPVYDCILRKELYLNTWRCSEQKWIPDIDT